MSAPPFVPSPVLPVEVDLSVDPEALSLSALEDYRTELVNAKRDIESELTTLRAAWDSWSNARAYDPEHFRRQRAAMAGCRAEIVAGKTLVEQALSVVKVELQRARDDNWADLIEAGEDAFAVDVARLLKARGWTLIPPNQTEPI